MFVMISNISHICGPTGNFLKNHRLSCTYNVYFIYNVFLIHVSYK